VILPATTSDHCTHCNDSNRNWHGPCLCLHTFPFRGLFLQDNVWADPPNSPNMGRSIRLSHLAHSRNTGRKPLSISVLRQTGRYIIASYAEPHNALVAQAGQPDCGPRPVRGSERPARMLSRRLTPPPHGCHRTDAPDANRTDSAVEHATTGSTRQGLSSRDAAPSSRGKPLVARLYPATGDLWCRRFGVRFERGR